MESLVFTQLSASEVRQMFRQELESFFAENQSADKNINQEAADDPLDDFIPKHEVRGKLASSATLWKWEKAGKIKSYGIGGKRFYKRSELADLFTEVK